jgi:hypothetical protein
MEYKVVEAKDEAINLEELVNRHIEEGWVPIGGVAVGYSPQSYNWWFYQAMVKQGDSDEEQPLG